MYLYASHHTVGQNTRVDYFDGDSTTRLQSGTPPLRKCESWDSYERGIPALSEQLSRRTCPVCINICKGNQKIQSATVHCGDKCIQYGRFHQAGESHDDRVLLHPQRFAWLCAGACCCTSRWYKLNCTV